MKWLFRHTPTPPFCLVAQDSTDKEKDRPRTRQPNHRHADDQEAQAEQGCPTTKETSLFSFLDRKKKSFYFTATSVT
jgi:hypothetical protein